MWDLYGEGGRPLGSYDAVVIAHNGKCAERLVAPADVPAVHAQLRAKFAPKAAGAGASQVMTLCSLWVVMVAFEGSLGLAFEGAHVEVRGGGRKGSDGVVGMKGT